MSHHFTSSLPGLIRTMTGAIPDFLYSIVCGARSRVLEHKVSFKISCIVYHKGEGKHLQPAGGGLRAKQLAAEGILSILSFCAQGA